MQNTNSPIGLKCPTLPYPFKAKGTYKRGDGPEKNSKLATFMAWMEKLNLTIDSIAYLEHERVVWVMIRRSHWEVWTGDISYEEFRALKSILPVNTPFTTL